MRMHLSAVFIVLACAPPSSSYYTANTCNKGETGTQNAAAWIDAPINPTDLPNMNWFITDGTNSNSVSVTCANCQTELSASDYATSVSWSARSYGFGSEGFIGTYSGTPTGWTKWYTRGVFGDCLCADNHVALTSMRYSQAQITQHNSYRNGILEFWTDLSAMPAGGHQGSTITLMHEKDTNEWGQSWNLVLKKRNFCIPCPKIDGIQTISTRGAQVYSSGEITSSTGCQCPEGYEGKSGRCDLCSHGKYSRLLRIPDVNGACALGTASTFTAQDVDDFKSINYWLDLDPPSSNGIEPYPPYVDYGYYTNMPDGSCNVNEESRPWRNSGCLTCPTGWSTATIGSTSVSQCNNCDMGYYGDGVTCTACPANTYNSNTGQTLIDACVSCPPNSFSPTASYTSNQCLCNAGYYGNYAVGCTACPAHSQSTSDSVVCLCNAGFSGPDQNSNSEPCVLCASGTYKESIGAGACQECPSTGSLPDGTGCLACDSIGKFGSWKSLDVDNIQLIARITYIGSTVVSGCLSWFDEMPRLEANLYCSWRSYLKFMSYNQDSNELYAVNAWQGQAIWSISLDRTDSTTTRLTGGSDSAMTLPSTFIDGPINTASFRLIGYTKYSSKYECLWIADYATVRKVDLRPQSRGVVSSVCGYYSTSSSTVSGLCATGQTSVTSFAQSHILKSLTESYSGKYLYTCDYYSNIWRITLDEFGNGVRSNLFLGNCQHVNNICKEDSPHGSSSATNTAGHANYQCLEQDGDITCEHTKGNARLYYPSDMTTVDTNMYIITRDGGLARIDINEDTVGYGTVVMLVQNYILGRSTSNEWSMTVNPDNTTLYLHYRVGTTVVVYDITTNSHRTFDWSWKGYFTDTTYPLQPWTDNPYIANSQASIYGIVATSTHLYVNPILNTYWQSQLPIVKIPIGGCWSCDTNSQFSVTTDNDAWHAKCAALGGVGVGGAYCCDMAGCDTSSLSRGTASHRCSNPTHNLPCIFEEYYTHLEESACTCNAGYEADSGGVCTMMGCDPGSRTVAGVCQACAENTYQNASGFTGSFCTACPVSSTTLGVSGATDVSQCKCDTGYAGDLILASDTCTVCEANSYTDTPGSSECIACPEYSQTKGGGHTTSTACKCSPGFTGPDGGACTACVANTYKYLVGVWACTPCVASSSTLGETGATSDTACKCDAGYSGPDGGACVVCNEDYFKDTTGSAQCSACPTHSSTGTLEGSTSLSDCKCVPGYETDSNEVYPFGCSCGACSALPTPAYTTGAIQYLDNSYYFPQLSLYRLVHSGNWDVNNANFAFGIRFKVHVGANWPVIVSMISTTTAVIQVRCGNFNANPYYCQVSQGSTKHRIFLPQDVQLDVWCTAFVHIHDNTFSSRISFEGYDTVYNYDSTFAINYGGGSLTWTFGTDNSYTYEMEVSHFYVEYGTVASDWLQTAAFSTACAAGCVGCADGYAKPDLGPGACYECAARDAHSTSIDNLASVACQCEAGYAWNGTMCEACPRAYYKDAVGNTSEWCELDPGELCCQCTPYKVTLQTASYDVADCLCIPGYGAATASDQCYQCATGSYKDWTGSGLCLPCPTGGTTVSESSTNVGACLNDAGFITVSGEFEACPSDTYQPEVNGDACLACPTGAVSSPGSTTEADCSCNAALGYVARHPDRTDLVYCPCAAGYYAVAGGACAQCPIGQFCPGSDTGYTTTNGSGDTIDGTAQDCPSNAHTLVIGATSSTDCVCDAGYTEAAPGAARRLLAVTCVQCTSGHYKATAGNDACDACPMLSTSPAASTLLSACKCIAGYTGPDGGQCQACAEGTYKSNEGSAECDICPVDSSSSAASDALTDCECVAGHDGSAGGACSDCAPNTYKATGDTNCQACDPNAASGAGSTALTDCLCNAGYTGPDGGACAACAAGTFKAALGSAGCSPCHAESFSPTGSTMQYQQPPAAISACSECICQASGTPAQGSGSCTDVQSLSNTEGNLVIASAFASLRITLPEAHNLSKIEVKVRTGGSWMFFTSIDTYITGAACKQFVLAVEVLTTIDVSDCPAGIDMLIAYIEPQTTLMILDHFVVYGAPPASCTCNAGYAAEASVCSACTQNSYKEIQGDAACTQCPNVAESPAAATSVEQCACPSGYTGNAGIGDDCTGCPIDAYKAGAGAAVCEACPTNSAAPALSDAPTDCLCNAGYTGSDGEACTACAAGTFKSAIGSAACDACPGDSSSPSASDALTDCVCNSGYTGNDGEACTACASDTFKSATGSAACGACPDHSSSPAASDAQTDCLCNAGYTGENGSPCSACVAGKYKFDSGADECLPCPTHSSSPAASTQSSACVCPPGYSGGHGSACTLCLAGSFEDTSLHSCWPCSAHSTSPEGSDAQTDCTCNAGYQGPDGGQCNACDPNTFKNTSGSAACTACTEFSTSASASDSADDCVCDTGYVKTGDGSCGRVCAAGYQMSADRTECLSCPNSYYKAEGGEHMCTRCPEHAMHGLTGQTSVDACYCEQGYLWDADTKTCAMCPAGSFNNRANESQCFDCPVCESGASVGIGPNIVTLIQCDHLHEMAGKAGGVTYDSDHWHLEGGILDFGADYTYAALTSYTGIPFNIATTKTFCIFIRLRRFTLNYQSILRIFQWRYAPEMTSWVHVAGTQNIGHYGRDAGVYAEQGVWLEIMWWIDASGYSHYEVYDTESDTTSTQTSKTPYSESAMQAFTSLVFCLGRGDGASEYYLNLDIQPDKTTTIDVSHFYASDTLFTRPTADQLSCTPAEPSNTQCPGLCLAPAGYQTTASGANLEPCPVNHYNDGSLLKCAQCPSPATFSSLGGLTGVAECVCQPGYERVGGVCTACGLGTYKSTPGDGPCSPCWAHATTLQTASTSHENCKCVPNYGANVDCTLCKGHYGPGGTSSEMLESDRVWTCNNRCNCRDIADESPCEPCIACKAHEFKHVTEYWPCVGCPLNSTLSPHLPHGPTSCECDPGFTGDAGQGSGDDLSTWPAQTLCTPCPIGKYKASSGSAACVSCGDHTETALDASTTVEDCLCVSAYEDGPSGGPDVFGVCVPSCQEGSIGTRGQCTLCAAGKFNAKKGQQSCESCPSHRPSSRKGATGQAKCSCPRGKMGLNPSTFHAIGSVGALSDQDVLTTAVTPGEVVRATATHRLKRLLIGSAVGCTLEIFVAGRRVFGCQDDCPIETNLFGVHADLQVVVQAGTPSLQLERHTRRVVTVTQAPQWWDQAEVERLALSRNLDEGDYIYNTRNPFSADHCETCPKKLQCKDFI